MLQKERARLVAKKEKNDAKIAFWESENERINYEMKRLRLEFEALVAAPL